MKVEYLPDQVTAPKVRPSFVIRPSELSSRHEDGQTIDEGGGQEEAAGESEDSNRISDFENEMEQRLLKNSPAAVLAENLRAANETPSISNTSKRNLKRKVKPS